MFRKLCPSLLVLVLAQPTLRAGDDFDFPRDLLHTLLARRALFQDRELGPLNLGVKVHHRIATLWGPVPSADLAQRAVQVLRLVPDFVEVKSELQVDALPGGPMMLPDVIPERLRLPAVTPV